MRVQSGGGGGGKFDKFLNYAMYVSLHCLLSLFSSIPFQFLLLPPSSFDTSLLVTAVNSSLPLPSPATHPPLTTPKITTHHRPPPASRYQQSTAPYQPPPPTLYTPPILLLTALSLILLITLRGHQQYPLSQCVYK